MVNKTNNNIFQYKKDYELSEYIEMCNQFAGLKLPLINSLPINVVCADYIFAISNKKIRMGFKFVLRRILGSVFRYKIVKVKQGDSNIAFLFTGDGNIRPDYIDALYSASNQINSDVFVLDRSKYKFSVYDLRGLFLILLWYIRLNKIIKDRSISIDMAAQLFKSINNAKFIKKKLDKENSKGIIDFCDHWSIDAVLIQLLNQDKYQTATLQHGNGAEIFPFSCSKYFLCNSNLSVEVAKKCGLNNDRLICLGPMKYAGKSFEYKTGNRFKTMGVVFDGLNDFLSNIEMLKIAHYLNTVMNIECLVRFHPSNNKADYEDYLNISDVVCEDIKEFEKKIDFAIVCKSTLLTDFLYTKQIVFKYVIGEEFNDRFTGMQFSTQDQLENLIINGIQDNNVCIDSQHRIRNELFGESVTSESYQIFFEDYLSM
ncbi:MAG: hypothetical protein R3Y45_05360 [Bacillota bacterium]